MEKNCRFKGYIIHQYFDVDYDLIWDVVTQKIPDLHYEIIKILND